MRLFRSYGVHYRWTVRLTRDGIETRKEQKSSVTTDWNTREVVLAPWPWRKGF